MSPGTRGLPEAAPAVCCHISVVSCSHTSVPHLQTPPLSGAAHPSPPRWSCLRFGVIWWDWKCAGQGSCGSPSWARTWHGREFRHFYTVRSAAFPVTAPALRAGPGSPSPRQHHTGVFPLLIRSVSFFLLHKLPERTSSGTARQERPVSPSRAASCVASVSPGPARLPSSGPRTRVLSGPSVPFLRADVGPHCSDPDSCVVWGRCFREVQPLLCPPF